jgi:hypothetical protein
MEFCAGSVAPSREPGSLEECVAPILAFGIAEEGLFSVLVALLGYPTYAVGEREVGDLTLSLHAKVADRTKDP